MDSRFMFWQRWLFWASVGIGVLGVGLAVLGMALLGPLDDLLRRCFWPSGAVPGEAEAAMRWLVAVLGATMAAWAVILAFVVHGPFRAGEAWAWRSVLWSVAVWFPLDTGLSLFWGAWPNALFNTGALLLVGPPLWATRRAFRREAVAIQRTSSCDDPLGSS